MNPKDFDGIYKWKFLVPIIYIMNWSLVIIGPLLIPYAYQIFCMTVIVYSLLKGLGLCLGTLVSLINLKKTIKKLKLKGENAVPLPDAYFHAMVIPSYKQDEQILLQTINMLSLSPRAKTQFIIFLAMEAHQQGSNLKANKLIQKTKQKFYHMDYTQHVLRPGQAKGKASNVSWCVEHFQQKLQPLMIDMNKVIITILDADSWSPKEYFQLVQQQLQKRPQIKDLCMFSAPQIFTRNHLKSPLLNRCYDTMHSLAQLSNLVAVKFRFPLSNYTVSYNLMKNIGWWDTCADAIGQDFHTTQKCYWKTKRPQNFHTISIFVPFNQLSLSTGDGCFKDMIARFWQAQRHCLGVSDVAYCFHMLFNTRFRFTNLWMTLLVFQIYIMTAFIPWALLGLGIQYSFMDTSIRYFPMWLIQLLLNGATFFSGASYIFYQWWRRVSNTQIYKLKNDKWWRVLEFPLNFPVALFGFSIPAFVMASFSVLCMTTQYRVAEKRVQKQNIVQKIAPSISKKKNSLIKNKKSIDQNIQQVAKPNKPQTQIELQLSSKDDSQQQKQIQQQKQEFRNNYQTRNNHTSDQMINQIMVDQGFKQSSSSSSGSGTQEP